MYASAPVPRSIGNWTSLRHDRSALTADDLYQSRPGEWIPANPYIPTHAHGRAPGVLFQFGHSKEGKGLATCPQAKSTVSLDLGCIACTPCYDEAVPVKPKSVAVASRIPSPPARPAVASMSDKTPQRRLLPNGA
jgi:hypothetical protein